ncbi:enoyl-CoA hydratase/isomerase family protein [Mycolicibacterium thermoresistibile]|uniref:Oxidoreductase n=2 Tax=Mycolicibacterium thermoresistibile TaxID=1797 RepID=G7CN36_MYCT3|nr:enoyl-CoA hydratase-related protein [Mycolicibacterium thermoresistibile]EHI10525.1 oxidoreductase [Mycolicibacterium thermoresistibile ATCC 19527]MCV7189663.1 enoyl-CoA hydratase/isomerase family protein [Mycolicibacterium thermoresistibile]GAT15423.1 enoyl-CoA hydratase [Mycolicibacterium thermoresistibile]SNW17482.1 enoyl-CoA hydratase paaG [Mycolicibacterium thermoresistibile]
MADMADEQPGIGVVTDGDGVRRITIDRVDVGNSLSPLARDALTEAIRDADRDPAVRAVLLTAAGSRHFCTGAGISADSRPGQRRPGDVARLLQQGWQRLVASILDCAKPVVAAVNGTAAGAGAGLVLAADLVVMSERAMLVEPFVARGILPDSGAVYLLTRIVGLRRATELLMLGEPVDAARCEQLGLVNRVVAPDAVYPSALELARRLAAGPTVMLSLTKRLLAVSSESSRDRAFTEEAWAQEIVSTTRDLQEGLCAFAERREPRFNGY